jgi:hypothetical protein
MPAAKQVKTITLLNAIQNAYWGNNCAAQLSQHIPGQ